MHRRFSVYILRTLCIYMYILFPTPQPYELNEEEENRRNMTCELHCVTKSEEGDMVLTIPYVCFCLCLSVCVFYHYYDDGHDCIIIAFVI